MSTALAYTYISALRTIFIFGVVSIAQLVEVMDSAVLGCVAEVVSSNPTVGHKNHPSIVLIRLKYVKKDVKLQVIHLSIRLM